MRVGYIHETYIYTPYTVGGVETKGIVQRSVFPKIMVHEFNII